MGVFDDLNRRLGLEVLTPPEMNQIHFETGQHSPVSANGEDTAMSIAEHNNVKKL